MSAMKRPEEVSKTSRPMKTTLLGLAALLLAGGFAARQLSSWPARLRYPGEHTDIEGMRLAEMVHLRQGIAIYAPPSAERFDAAIYGPLYYLLGSQVIDANRPAYFRLRLLSLVATIGCAACCGLLAFWLGRSYIATALAPLLFLSYGFAARVGASARADSLAVLLAFSGLLVAYRGQHSRAILYSVPLMLAAFFYKQQFVAGPLAVALFLMIQKRHRVALQFVGLMGLGVFTLIGLFQFIVFPGQAFLEHFLFYNMIPLSWPHFAHAGLMFFGLVLLVPVLMGLEFLRIHRVSLLGCYLGGAIVLGLVTTARAGSDAQYWYESVLILSALVAALVAERVESDRRPSEVIVLLAFTTLVAQFFVPPAPRPEDLLRDQAIQDFLRRRFSPHTRVLTRYAGDTTRAGLDVPLDVDTYLYLVSSGKFGPSQQESMLRAQRYGVVVLNVDLKAENSPKVRMTGFPQPWVLAILEEYEEIGSLEMPGPEKILADDRFHVWAPRPHHGEPNRTSSH
jgi:hypothetical protein